MINKTGRIGKMFSSYGLAQIPLLIGLLIMAIAVPVATKLVEENQDTRNLAVCSPVGEFCVSTSNCCSGQCVNNICGGGYASPTPKPLATSTPRPENTSTPRPENTSTPRPTAVTYTCTNTSGQFCSYPSCQTIGADYGSGTCPSSTSFCCKPKPTNTPTPKPSNLCPNGSVSVCTGKTIGSSCVNAVAPGMAATCKIMPSSSACTCVTVSTNTPTNTPPTVCKNVGSQCFDPRDCCSGQCSATGSCCLSNGTASKVASNCCSGYLGNDLGGNATVCAPKPTNTPVPTVTSTPKPATGTCTTFNSSQWCTAGSCNAEGGTIGVGLCSGEQYCCKPKTEATGTCTINNPAQWCTSGLCRDNGGTVGVGTCDGGLYCCKPATSATATPKPPTATPTSGSGGPIVNPPTATPTSGSGGPIDNPPTNTPVPSGNTCDESLTGSKLQCCHPPDSDGTSDDSLCNRAGRVATCGGTDYCCPTLNGNWTTDMSKCSTNLKCTQCANGKNRSIGDADCNGVVDVNDRSIWTSEFVSDGGNRTDKNSWMSDFDCNGVVDVNDRSIWTANFTI